MFWGYQPEFVYGRYERDYTSVLTEFDYLDPESLNGTQLHSLDEWSAIIPLIKAHNEDYADTGRYDVHLGCNDLQLCV